MPVTKRKSESKITALCTCNGGKMAENGDHKVLYVTRTEDGETCAYCGYYAQFRTQADLQKTNIEFMELKHGNGA